MARKVIQIAADPAIYTRFAVTERFFGWSTTLATRWHRSLKTIRETPVPSLDLDLFRSRMSPAAEAPPVAR